MTGAGSLPFIAIQTACAEKCLRDVLLGGAIANAIESGSVNALNYFVAQKYVEAFAKLADSPQQRTVIVPTDMAGIAGSIAGIAELVNAARRDSTAAAAAPRRPAVPPTGA